MSKGFLYDTGDELITREDVNEVPDGSTASAGDVLSLDSNKKPKWSTPESGLPDTTGASAGDVLSLDSDKEPVWSAPSGGGGGESYRPIAYDIIIESDEEFNRYYVKFYYIDDDEHTGIPFSTLASLDCFPAYGAYSSLVYAGEEDGSNYITAVVCEVSFSDATKTLTFTYYVIPDDVTINDTDTQFLLDNYGYINTTGVSSS